VHKSDKKKDKKGNQRAGIKAPCLSARACTSAE